MQHGNGYKRGDIKPDGYIEVAFPSFKNGTEHVDTKNHPYERNGNINRPFQLSIFVRSGKAQRQGNYSRKDDELPAPEMYGA
ncbi:hypothetical protein D3C85_1173290 [compost metagenome]